MLLYYLSIFILLCLSGLRRYLFVDETAHWLTMYFHISLHIIALILMWIDDHVNTSHTTDITWPFLTQSDHFWSKSCSANCYPILSCWITSLPSHCHQDSRLQSTLKIYQLSFSLLSSSAHWHIKTVRTCQHSHFSIPSASATWSYHEVMRLWLKR